jgi:hypothetical protein
MKLEQQKKKMGAASSHREHGVTDGGEFTPSNPFSKVE